MVKITADYLTPSFRNTPALRGRLRVGLVLGLLLALTACKVVRTMPQPLEDVEKTVAQKTASSPTPSPSRTPFPTPSVTPLPTSIINVPTSSLQDLSIRFWHPYTGEAQVLLDLITREFNKTNTWGIQVENTSIPGFTRLEQRLHQAAETKSLPDMWTMSTYQALQIDANGTVVADLSPYIEDAVFGLSDAEQEDFLPALWQQDLVPPPALKGRTSPQDKRMGLPFVRSGALLVYNQTWARELGFSRPPETPEEFREQVCAAAQANNADSEPGNDGSGGWLVTGNPVELIGWLQAFGAQISRQDGRGYQFDTPEARQAVTFLYDLRRDGCAWLSPAAAPETALSERKALLAVMPLDDLVMMQLAFPVQAATSTSSVPTAITATPADGTKIIPTPAPSATVEPQDTWLPLPFPSSGSPAVVAFGPSLVVGQSQPERQLAAWLFARWLTLPENQTRWVQQTHALPVRRSAVDSMQSQRQEPPAWGTSLFYLSYLQPEPYYVSWGVVRLTLGDAVQYLFQLDYSAEQVAQIPAMLDELAAEIQIQIR